MAQDVVEPASGIARLIAVMAALRTPATGCPWDIAQTHQTIAPYTIEEAYEVADAIERFDDAALKEELGDLLFNVVYHARLAEERGAFDFEDVANAAAEKMIRRHPHVFAAPGDPMAVAARADLSAAWSNIKAAEKGEKQPGEDSALDGVAPGLPAFIRAVKLQKKAVKAGFDWPDTSGLVNKLDEEVAELKAELSDTGDRNALGDEIGDLLFVLCNIAWRHDVEPETALRRANRKFTARYQAMEAILKASNRQLAALDWATRKNVWEQAKAVVKADDPKSGSFQMDLNRSPEA